MLLTVIMGCLAAFGAVCALACLLGLALPKPSGAAVCLGRTAFAMRWLWLRELGLIPGRLIWAECPLNEGERARLQDRGVEFCSLAELPARLAREAETLGGTGAGDLAGRGQRGGVPKL